MKNINNVLFIWCILGIVESEKESVLTGTLSNPPSSSQMEETPKQKQGLQPAGFCLHRPNVPLLHSSQPPPPTFS